MVIELGGGGGSVVFLFLFGGMIQSAVVKDEGAGLMIVRFEGE